LREGKVELENRLRAALTGLKTSKPHQENEDRQWMSELNVVSLTWDQDADEVVVVFRHPNDGLVGWRWSTASDPDSETLVTDSPDHAAMLFDTHLREDVYEGVLGIPDEDGVRWLTYSGDECCDDRPDSGKS
jgi:hypothetical protein